MNIPLEEVTGDERLPADGAALPPTRGTIQLDSTITPSLHVQGDAAVEICIAGYVSAGKDLHAARSMIGAAVAGKDLSLTGGSARAAVTGKDMVVSNGRVVAAKAGRDVHLTSSRAVVLAGRQLSALDSTIGFVISRQIILGDRSRVLLGTPQAAALGAAFGLIFAIVSWLLKRE